MLVFDVTTWAQQQFSGCQLGDQRRTRRLVRLAKVGAPAGCQPIEWILLTSLVVENFEDAWVVIGYYEKRWQVEFYRELAKLGGFIGRTSDGEPGWITIWRGWQ